MSELTKELQRDIDYIKKVSDLEGKLSDEDWKNRREEIRLAHKAIGVINDLLGIEDTEYNGDIF